MKLQAYLVFLALGYLSVASVHGEEVEILQMEHEETIHFETVDVDLLEMDAIKKLPIKALRKKLLERGVECKGCAEKDDFVTLYHEKQALPILPIGTNSAEQKEKGNGKASTDSNGGEYDPSNEPKSASLTPEEKAKQDADLDDLLAKLGNQGFGKGRTNVFKPEDFEGLTQEEMASRFEQESRKNRVRDRAGKKKRSEEKSETSSASSTSDGDFSSTFPGFNEDNNDKKDKKEKKEKKSTFKQRGGAGSRRKRGSNSKGKSSKTDDKDDKEDKEDNDRKGGEGDKDKDEKKEKSQKKKSPFKTRVPGASRAKSSGSGSGSGNKKSKAQSKASSSSGKRKAGVKYTRKERTGARPEEMEFGETDIFEEPELSEIFDDDETLEDILNEGFGHVDEDEGEGEGAKMKEKEKEKAKVKAEAKAKTKVKEEVELGGGWVVGEDEDIIEL